VIEMRSMSQILWIVIDNEINTPEQGAALLDEEAKNYAEAMKIPEAEARALLLSNIDDSAKLCLKGDAEKLRKVYELHLPIKEQS